MRVNTIVVLGKPGSGKGTQAKLLSQKSGFKLFSTSGALRELAKRTDPTVGAQVIKDIEEGILVPHWMVEYLWTDEILRLPSAEGIIFDGAVRKEPEARLFDEVMDWLGRKYVVLYLTLSDEELRTRLAKRLQIEKREDDGEAVITKRLEEYHRNTEGSLSFFKEKGVLLEIDGERPIEVIHEDIMQQLS